MKKFIATLLLSVFLVSSAAAYTLTESDNAILQGVYKKIESLSQKNQTKILEKIEKVSAKTAEGRMKSLLEAVVSKYSVSVTQSGSEYKVVKVVDGDTIDVEGSGGVLKIRILGLDTPEKYTTRTGYKECYGDEASARAQELLGNKTVTIEQDFTQDKIDKYGRTLAHVFIGGELYQEKVIREGYGFRYVYKTPTKYDSRLLKAEEDAKLQNVGVWAKCEGKRKPIDQVVTETKSSVDTILGTGSTTAPAAVVTPTTTSPVIIPVPPIVTAPIGSFSCSVKKTYCSQMNTCQEAKFYLNSCGLSRLDADKDGVPCESICK